MTCWRNLTTVWVWSPAICTLKAYPTRFALRDRAEREFASPHQVDLMVAVAQPIIAVATERGWPSSSHGAFRSVVKLLATQYDDPRLVTFSTARKICTKTSTTTT